jgi:hypothetical protein
MSLATILAALAAMAVNFGWQKADDGYEYLVQLEPETLELLQEGIEVPIDSHVPKGVQPIRRVRIVVGKAVLPGEESTAGDNPALDPAVEHTSNWQPRDGAATPEGRYPSSPPTSPQSPLDTAVQPLRDVDNYVEQGFEKAVDGLENTGRSMRNAMNDLGANVQDQVIRGKELLVGPTRENTAAAGSGAAQDSAAQPWWTSGSTAQTNDGGPSLPGLPPPPLAGGSPPVEPPTTTAAPVGSNLETTTTPSLPASPDTSTGNRMVTVESQNSTPTVPAWDPNWPATEGRPASSQFADWPPQTAAASNQPAQAGALTGDPPPQAPPDTTSEAPLSSATSGNASLGGWALAIIGLAGSVGCNFFLGFSYLDIRNKYRAALRRTSRSFGRPAAGA